MRVSSLRKTFGAAQQCYVALDGVDLDIAEGEFFCLLGPSGCGKSTLLRMIAGLETITEGEISIGGRVVNGVEPKDRDIAMVFQNYALYPHMSVYDNISYGLRIRGLSKSEIDAKVNEAAKLLELAPFLDRKPRQLSGGQRQRVAMGRAIVREPAVFLFDEPLSNLDAKLRTQMRVEIKRLQARLGVTSLYVTHDQVEAMTLADRLMVMNAGVAEQVGTPMGIYHRPASVFVAGFIGSPAMNFLPAVYPRMGKASNFRAARCCAHRSRPERLRDRSRSASGRSIWRSPRTRRLARRCTSSLISLRRLAPTRSSMGDWAVLRKLSLPDFPVTRWSVPATGPLSRSRLKKSTCSTWKRGRGSAQPNPSPSRSGNGLPST